MSPSRLWRGAVCAAAVAAFGLGGALLGFLGFPLLALLPGGREVRERRARAVVRACFRALVAVFRAAGVLRLDVEGGEAFRELRGTLVVANHPTYLDVVLLLGLLPDALCVVKARLRSSVGFGGVLRAAGYIPNDASCMARCTEALAAGHNLVLFPEGTRSAPGAQPRFRRGAAHVALASGAPILPVRLSCDPPAWTKGRRLYNLPQRRCRFQLAARPPLPLRAWLRGTEPGPRAARRLTEALEAFFTQDTGPR